MRKILLIPLVIAMLGGCAGPAKITSYWWKDGGTEEQRRLDVDECATHKGDYRTVSNWQVLYGSPYIFIPIVGGSINIYRFQKQAAQPDLGFDSCMKAKGYELKEKSN